MCVCHACCPFIVMTAWRRLTVCVIFCVSRVCVIGSSPDGRVFFWKGTSEAVPYKEVKINLLNDSVIHSICSLEVQYVFLNNCVIIIIIPLVINWLCSVD